METIGYSQTDNCYYPYPALVPYTWPSGTGTGLTYYINTEVQRECAGDVHVFPCPHCKKCKCGQAIKAKGKR